MRILRSLGNAADIAAAEREAFVASLQIDVPDVTSHAFQSECRAMARRQSSFDRDAAEVAAIEAARPLGAPMPRVEPKSIDEPVPPSRLSFEPPRKRYVAPKPYKCPF